MTVGFALFEVVENRNVVKWQVNTVFVWPRWTKKISNIILKWFLSLIKKVNALVTLQEKRNCLLVKGNIAHLTSGIALRRLIVSSVKRLKRLFVHAKYIGTNCVRTVQVHNKFNDAIVSPKIRAECATRQICSD